MTTPHSMGRLILRLMTGALFSKGLGLAREILMALIVGTALAADSFRTAITAVLLPISFFQAETVPAVLIPMQKEAMAQGRAAITLAAMTSGLVIVTVPIMLLTQLGAPLLVDLLVGGFSEEGRRLTVDFVRIMALAMPASVMLNCLSAGEIALGRARISNARSAIQNLGILLGLGCIAFGAPVILLATAFALSFNGLALFSLRALQREGALDFTGLTPAIILKTIKIFFRRLGPFLALPLGEQANIWLERLFTSRLQAGAIASLDYARTLTESFLLLVSQPVGLAVLSGASHSQEGQARMIMRAVLAFALPACAFLFVFSADIVTLVFRRGAFGETGVMLTSAALRGISVGLWASTLGWIMLRLLNSAGRNGRAVVILLLSYGANMGFNILIAMFPQTAFPGITLIGLGESLRSLVLLAGVLIALRQGKAFIGAFLLALVPAVFVVVGGDILEETIPFLLPRLFACGSLLLAGWLLSVMLLLPGLLTTLCRRLSACFSSGGDAR